MNKKANGLNVLDIKKKNRCSILELIHQQQQLSRKSIASALGLTPAAITLITSDLINEGLLIEAATQESSRKGRKETYLKINAENYFTIGVSISRTKFKIACIDLDCHILFEESFSTKDCTNRSTKILAKICSAISNELENNPLFQNHTLLGIGISILGIVDSYKGISIFSSGIWEENVNVIDYIEENLHIPAILTNNICALAHGEAFLHRSTQQKNTLFIKYGPGFGGAQLNSGDHFSIFDYSAVQLGHIIMDPNGRPCICGNQGCLETIVSYDSIEQSISTLISEKSAPELCRLVHGEPQNICMKYIMQSYEAGDLATTVTIRRVIHYMALAIKNAITSLEPESLILYGEFFDNKKFRQELSAELSKYSGTQTVTFSDFNINLETLGPATMMISYFFEKGGTI